MDENFKMAATPTFVIEIFDKKKTSFSRWVERLNCAFAIFAVADLEMKKNLLIHYMGQDAYEQLSDKVSPAKPKDKSFDEIVKLLEEYYDPQPLELVENFRYHLRKQQENESIQDFTINLKKLSKHCNFGAYLNTALRNQFVFGIKSSKIQNRLLEMKNLTFELAVETATAMEMSEKGSAEIHRTGNTSGIVQIIQKGTKSNSNYSNKNSFQKANSNKFQKNYHNKTESNYNKNESNSKRYCYRCGGETHLAPKCPYADKKCMFCKRVGHTSQVCFKSKSENKISRNTNLIEVQEGEVDDLIEQIFTISNSNVNEKFWVNLEINKINIDFEVDTGSPVSLMNLTDKNNYFPDIEIENSNTELHSYCNKTINVYGQISVNVNFRNQSNNLRLFIVDSNRHPLIGREWIRILHVNLNSFLQNQNINSIEKNLTIHSQLESKCDNLTDKLLHDYPNVFQKSIGKITNLQVKINLKPDCDPIFIKARPCPFAIKQVVENELENLVNEGILTKVDFSRWATPIVPVRKAGNKIRICGDYKVSVNPRILIDEHPLPTIEELFLNMAGGGHFSKIDLSKAYLQLEIQPEDREILTLSTHKGLYRPNLLMYGVASAPAIWQRHIEQILQDIPGVTVFIDDIKITGPDKKTHLDRLFEVMNRLNKYNMKINLDKCEFFKRQIEYCGYVIDKNGIHKMKKTIKAIMEMPKPQNKDQVRVFVGLVNYYGRFFKNLSSTLFPINNLLKKDVDFKWDKDCQKAFETVKTEMQTDKCLVHYDLTLPLLLATDACPYGFGAFLSHRYPDGTERPIHYASQTLNPTQQKYSQIDKEAYAIIYGVRKFHQYLYGRKFTIISDNTPIIQIFSPHKGLPTLSTTRMQHYAIFLQAFDYDIQYKNTKHHANADAMSRLPSVDEEYRIEECDIVDINSIETMPLLVQELASETLQDKNLKILIEALKSGKKIEPKFRFGIDQNEFSLQKDCILRGIRAVIPLTLRKRVLDELHSTHFGITRLKSLARSYCWWEGIDGDIENMIKNCAECQAFRANPPKATIHCWERPNEPFQRVHADFAGPFMGKYFFIMVDAYSKYPFVNIMNNITATTTIKYCREIFGMFGIPSVFVSDNGTQFTSEEFQHFLKLNGIVHKLSAPYHPATNGQAERYVQTIKDKLNCLQFEKDIHRSLNNILLTYRKTIHPSTGKSPAVLIFGRQIKSRLDLMIPEVRSMPEDALENIRSFKIDDRVAVREYISKHSKWKFGNVVEILGRLHYIIKLDDNRLWKRHVNQMRAVGSNTGLATTPNSDDARSIPNLLSIPDLPVNTPEKGTPELTKSSEGRTAQDEIVSPTPDNVPVDISIPESTQNKPIERNNPCDIRNEPDRLSSESVQPNVSSNAPVDSLRRSERMRKPPKKYDSFVKY